jgi:hypothetical protein
MNFCANGRYATRQKAFTLVSRWSRKSNLRPCGKPPLCRLRRPSKQSVEIASCVQPKSRAPINGDGCWVLRLAETGCAVLTRKHDCGRAWLVRSGFAKPFRVVARDVVLCARVGLRLSRCQARKNYSNHKSKAHDKDPHDVHFSSTTLSIRRPQDKGK